MTERGVLQESFSRLEIHPVFLDPSQRVSPSTLPHCQGSVPWAGMQESGSKDAETAGWCLPGPSRAAEPEATPHWQSWTDDGQQPFLLDLSGSAWGPRSQQKDRVQIPGCPHGGGLEDTGLPLAPSAWLLCRAHLEMHSDPGSLLPTT